MRKIFTIFFITIFISSGLLAQKKKLHVDLDYGMKTGMNFSHFLLRDLQDNEHHDFNSKWRTGFVLGMFLRIPLYKQFSIQTEFLYSSMGGDYYTPTSGPIGYQHIRARYNYFSIPVMAKYKLNNHVSFVAGPQFDFLIAGKERNSSGTFKVSDDLKDFDGMVTGGVEFNTGKTFNWMIRYMRGFNDLENRANGVRFYQEGVQATVGIKFN
jgi:hypothetical protein